MFREAKEAEDDGTEPRADENACCCSCCCKAAGSDDDEDEGIFYEMNLELLNVGARLGGRYRYTSKLKVLNYKEAMASNKKRSVDKRNR